jgi:hypothetical protein
VFVERSETNLGRRPQGVFRCAGPERAESFRSSVVFVHGDQLRDDEPTLPKTPNEAVPTPARERIEVFIPHATDDSNMSKATKIVLGTVLVTAVLATLQIVNMWLA